MTSFPPEREAFYAEVHSSLLTGEPHISRKWLGEVDMLISEARVYLSERGVNAGFGVSENADFYVTLMVSAG